MDKNTTKSVELRLLDAVGYLDTALVKVRAAESFAADHFKAASRLARLEGLVNEARAEVRAYRKELLQKIEEDEQ
jgi:hypothetical protein